MNIIVSDFDVGGNSHSLWSNYAHSCDVLQNSDVLVFTVAVARTWIKGKQPVLTSLLRGTSPPPLLHSVWSGAFVYMKKNKTVLHFKFAAFQKLQCLWVWSCQTKEFTGRDDSSDKRVVRNFLSLETHHYWVYDHIRAVIHSVRIWPCVSPLECHT